MLSGALRSALTGGGPIASGSYDATVRLWEARRAARNACRLHRQVQNSLHRVLDVTFRQGECRIGTGNDAANFATIKHAAMNLPRRAPGKMSLPRKRHSAAWDDDDMEKIIHQ